MSSQEKAGGPSAFAVLHHGAKPKKQQEGTSALTDKTAAATLLFPREAARRGAGSAPGLRAARCSWGPGSGPSRGSDGGAFLRLPAPARAGQPAVAGARRTAAPLGDGAPPRSTTSGTAQHRARVTPHPRRPLPQRVAGATASPRRRCALPPAGGALSPAGRAAGPSAGRGARQWGRASSAPHAAASSPRLKFRVSRRGCCGPSPR